MARVALDADIVIASWIPGTISTLPPLRSCGHDQRPATSSSSARPSTSSLDSAGIAVIPVDRALARRAAALRATQHPSPRLPDAMSLATVIMTNATLVTLDKKLRKIALRVAPPSL